MRVTLNGEEREVPPGVTVAQLLAQLGLGAQPVAVELDGQVVPKAQHETRVVPERCTLEIVTFVGGG